VHAASSLSELSASYEAFGLGCHQSISGKLNVTDFVRRVG